MNLLLLCAAAAVLSSANRFWTRSSELCAGAADAAVGIVLWVLAAFLLPVTGWTAALPILVYASFGRAGVLFRKASYHAVYAASSYLLCMEILSALRSVSDPLNLVPAAVAVAIAVLLSVSTCGWAIPALAASFLIGISRVLLYATGSGEGDPAALSAAAAALLSVYIIAESIVFLIRRKVFDFSRNPNFKLWRVVARPFAVLFVLIDILTTRRILLYVIGVLALIFIVTDFVRLATKAELRSLFKQKERNRFSSMTLFLVSVFLAFLLFPATVPYVSLICITFGDFFSKFIGIRFGTRKLFKSKTLEGTFGFLSGSLLFNTVGSLVLPIPFLYVVIGSGIAAVVELLSDAIDDNFSVTIVCGGVLTALRFFAGL